MKKTILSIMCLGFLTGVGCGGSESDDHEHTVADMSNEDECSGHGHLHDTSCHCDDGFAASDDGMSCIASTDDHHDHDEDMHAHDDDLKPHMDMGEDMPDTSDMHSPDEDMTGEDMGNDMDMSDDDMNTPVDEPEDIAFAATDAEAAVGLSHGSLVWLLGAKDNDVMLEMELYEAYGAPTSPGTITLGDDATDYASCGTCVVLKTGCEQHDDHAHCAKTFMPVTGGTVAIDTIDAEADGHLSGELSDIIFQEVTIGSDYVTTPVAQGQRLRLSSWTFDAELTSFGEDAECSGHGHLHGTTCHCDTGYQVDPDDPSQCIPQ